MLPRNSSSRTGYKFAGAKKNTAVKQRASIPFIEQYGVSYKGVWHRGQRARTPVGSARFLMTKSQDWHKVILLSAASIFTQF
ncbi:hypothetical protein TUM4438_28150 [Shewanella sairae]|uniref:Uncharacterized protein n=1 Tax=Shewanella sairae TaxID=190310 RepID=A0ABQ4PJX4_9GAMM|nr:hypothetical protein TUM4438_28150 [Shewanella sairae]